jgi:hypothetical protein
VEPAFTEMTVEEVVQPTLENVPIVENVSENKDPEVCKRMTAN